MKIKQITFGSDHTAAILADGSIACWGYNADGQCYEWEHSDQMDYVIDIAIDQSIRDTLATIFHECVHLWQWERGHWKGEGEREACQLQYELADEYWRCGNV